MSLRDQLLVLVLSERPTGKPVIVLSGRNEPEDETACRMVAARNVSFVVSLSQGANTAEEARTAVRQIASDVIICTSAYHQVRAFLTFLRALEQAHRDREVRLWNLPVWTQRVPIEEEWAKIAKYQECGDCTSYRAGLEYLAWRGP